MEHLRVHTQATLELVVGVPSDGSTIEWTDPELMRKDDDFAQSKLASHRQALERAPSQVAGRAVTHV